MSVYREMGTSYLTRTKASYSYGGKRRRPSEKYAFRVRLATLLALGTRPLYE